MTFTESRTLLVRGYYRVLERLLQPLARRGVSPNMITILSMAVSFVAGICYAVGAILAGGILMLLSGFIDTLDGSIARISGTASRFGALLDSSLDRYAEFFVFCGLLVYFREEWIFYVVMAAMMGSIMVSYVRARGEALGQVRIIGLMQRPERLIILAMGSILNRPVAAHLPGCPDCALIVTLVLLALLTNITVVHRLLAGRKDLTGQDS